MKWRHFVLPLILPIGYSKLSTQKREQQNKDTSGVEDQCRDTTQIACKVVVEESDGDDIDYELPMLQQSAKSDEEAGDSEEEDGVSTLSKYGPRTKNETPLEVRLASKYCRLTNESTGDRTGAI